MRRQRQQKNTSKEVVNGHLIVKIGRGVWRLETQDGTTTTGSKAKVTTDAYGQEPGPYVRADYD